MDIYLEIIHQNKYIFAKIEDSNKYTENENNEFFGLHEKLSGECKIENNNNTIINNENSIINNNIINNALNNNNINNNLLLKLFFLK